MVPIFELCSWKIFSLAKHTLLVSMNIRSGAVALIAVVIPTQAKVH